MKTNQSILLSYSAISNLIEHPHTWICKQLGFKPPKTPSMDAGIEGHLILQGHLTGEKPDDRLKNLEWRFQKKEHHAIRSYTDIYNAHGFIDAISFDSKVFCEAKFSSSLWGQSKFDNLIQWKYYAFVLGFRQVLFIAGGIRKEMIDGVLKYSPDFSNVKTYFRGKSKEYDSSITDEEVNEGEEFLKKGIYILDNVDLRSDLVNGKCLGCNYRENCYFA